MVADDEPSDTGEGPALTIDIEVFLNLAKYGVDTGYAFEAQALSDWLCSITSPYSRYCSVQYYSSCTSHRHFSGTKKYKSQTP